MPSNQANSQFWGTGTELMSVRENMDPIKARQLITALGTRLFGDRYDYTGVEFRGLYLPVTLVDRLTGERLEVTPYEHLTSEDGYGH